MIRNFFDQPVNFFLSSSLIFLMGVTMTSLVLDNQGMPNPLTAVGGGIATLLLASFYGKAALAPVIVS
jgi:hypothetical protein